MKKVIKIGFPILCVAIIGGTFILLNKTTERINRTKLKEDDIYNNTVENKIDEDIEVEEENKDNGNQIKNAVIDQEEIRVQEVKNKARAIELVKQLAPPTSNSYYTNEGMTGTRYLVAIRDNDTKEIKIYYSVDIEKEKIEVYVK